jgi:hypothetical protein
MAAQRFALRSGAGSKSSGTGHRNQRKAGACRTDDAYGVPLPEALHDAIETERSNLARAESVLGCLASSMEYEADSVNKPDYPDVARLARELVRQSINGLDSLVLQKQLLKNKIRESAAVQSVDGAYEVIDLVDSAHVRVCVSSSFRVLADEVPSPPNALLVFQQEQAISEGGLNPLTHH